MPPKRVEEVPASTSIIYAEKFGLVGDGKTDNTNRFLELCRVLREKGESHVTLEFAPGTYNYTNNRWLQNVKNIQINGNGAVFNNIRKNTKATQDLRPLNMGTPFQVKNDEDFNPRALFFTGDLLKSANTGQAYIELELRKNILEYSRGDRVLIHGFEQQFSGYPTNPRYFEYHEVKEVNKETGRLYLARKLSYDYNQDWFDCFYNNRGLVSGKPRVLKLDRSDYIFPENIVIRDVTFPSNPAVSHKLALYLPGSNIKLERVEAVGIHPSFNENFLCKECRISNFSEIDKLITKVSFEDSDIGSRGGRIAVKAATGADELTFRNCNFYGKLLLSPKKLILSDCELFPPPLEKFGALDSYHGMFPVDKVSVSNTIVHAESRDLKYGIGFDKIFFHILERDIRNGIYLLKDNEENRKKVISNLKAGVSLLGDGGKFEYKVKDIEYRKGNWEILFTESCSLPRNAKVYWAQSKEIVLDGSTRVKSNNTSLSANPIKSFNKRSGNTETTAIILTEKDLSYQLSRGLAFFKILDFVEAINVEIDPSAYNLPVGTTFKISVGEGNSQKDLVVLPLDKTISRSIPLKQFSRDSDFTFRKGKMFIHELRLIIKTGNKLIPLRSKDKLRGALKVSIKL